MVYLENSNRILIVDDETDIRDILSEELSSHGFVPILAENGEEALKLFESGEFAAVISDIRMPKMGGDELLKKIKTQINSPIPFILMTGFSDLTSEDAYHFGASLVIHKPFKCSELLEKLRQLLLGYRHRWSSPPVGLFNIKQVKGVLPADSHEPFYNYYTKLGTGGAFFPVEGASWPSEGEIIHWAIEVQKGGHLIRSIQGKGVVRWTQNSKSESHTPGVGVEFVYVENIHREFLAQLIEAGRPSSFIPNSLKTATLVSFSAGQITGDVTTLDT